MNKASRLPECSIWQTARDLDRTDMYGNPVQARNCLITNILGGDYEQVNIVYAGACLKPVINAVVAACIQRIGKRLGDEEDSHSYKQATSKLRRDDCRDRHI